jgi:CRISPR-associated protein Cas1
MTGPRTRSYRGDRHDDWAMRNALWLGKPKTVSARRAGRHKPAEPLILCGHGVSLSVDRGTLFIRDGLTHYPHERRTFRFFKGDPNLPPRLIMLDGSGGLTFDVLTWLHEQRLPFIKIDYQGHLISAVAADGSAFDPELVRWQVETRADPERRLAFCCDLIAEKIAATIETMRTALPDSRARVKALDKATRSIDRLQRRAVRSVNDILMAEAGAAASYFSAWNGLPLRWGRSPRLPVPPAWQFAEGRSAIRDRRGRTNRHATHPVNAMLNYAYGVLHSQVQIEAVGAGYDPRIGIMHESRQDAQALVLDLMEVRRPIVDAAVLKFVSAEMFAAADFSITEAGVCRLSPQLARRVAQLAR